MSMMMGGWKLEKALSAGDRRGRGRIHNRSASIGEISSFATQVAKYIEIIIDIQNVQLLDSK